MQNLDETLNDLVNKLQNSINEDMEKKYSKKTIKYSKNPINLGRMNDPDGAAAIKGLCGDTMEIYLIIENDIVTEIKFFTDGCTATLACGSVLTILAKGKNIYDLLKITPVHIIDELDGLPKDGIHCAILSVSTLYKAIADYLLKNGGCL